MERLTMFDNIVKFKYIKFIDSVKIINNRLIFGSFLIFISLYMIIIINQPSRYIKFRWHRLHKSVCTEGFILKACKKTTFLYFNSSSDIVRTELNNCTIKIQRTPFIMFGLFSITITLETEIIKCSEYSITMPRLFIQLWFVVWYGDSTSATAVVCAVAIACPV